MFNTRGRDVFRRSISWLIVEALLKFYAISVLLFSNIADLRDVVKKQNDLEYEIYEIILL